MENLSRSLSVFLSLSLPLPPCPEPECIENNRAFSSFCFVCFFQNNGMFPFTIKLLLTLPICNIHVLLPPEWHSYFHQWSHTVPWKHLRGCLTTESLFFFIGSLIIHPMLNPFTHLLCSERCSMSTLQFYSTELDDWLIMVHSGP